MLNYEDAICDLKVALDFEGTSSGKRQIQNDLKLMESQSKTESTFQELSGKDQLVIGELFNAFTFPSFTLLISYYQSALCIVHF